MTKIKFRTTIKAQVVVAHNATTVIIANTATIPQRSIVLIFNKQETANRITAKAKVIAITRTNDISASPSSSAKSRNSLGKIKYSVKTANNHERKK